MANAGYILTSGRPRVRRPAPKTAREWLERRLDDRPETAAMQRAKLATRDEKARAAIDCMTYHDVEEQKRGGVALPNEDKARAKMEKVAERCENRKDR